MLSVSARVDTTVISVAGCRQRGDTLAAVAPLERQDAHALDTERLGGPMGGVRDELVLRVLLNRLDGQAGGLDGGAVVVLLHGAADARRPELHVAHDRFGEVLLGDD